MNTDDTKAPQEEPLMRPPVKLTMDQKLHALHYAHTFFSQFDRVPGFAAIQWGQALDAVGVVLNSLVLEKEELEKPKD